MPLLLIAILGAAFGNMMKEDGDATIKKFTLGIVNLDTGPFGQVVAEEVFAKELSDHIQVKQYEEKEMVTNINNHQLSVGIVIGKDFSQSILSGNEAKVKLISIPDQAYKVTIVQSVLEQFTQAMAIETTAAKLLMAQPVQGGTTAESTQIAKTSEIQNKIEYQLYQEKTIKANTQPVSSFQYYAAAMGVMFLLMTVVQGVATMILEKEQEVYKRLLVSSLTFTHYLAGKMLGLIIIALVQAFVIIIGTRIIFGVEWGHSIAGVGMMTFAFVINTCGLGVLAGAMIKTEKTFSVAGMLTTQIFAAVGGSMAPLYIFPDWVIFVGKFLPNGLALQNYLELMSGASFLDILPSAAISLGLGMLFFSIALFRLTSERRGNYA